MLPPRAGAYTFTPSAGEGMSGSLWRNKGHCDRGPDKLGTWSAVSRICFPAGQVSQ
jgi:hypothetical protein